MLTRDEERRRSTGGEGAGAAAGTSSVAGSVLSVGDSRRLASRILASSSRASLSEMRA